MNLIVDLDDVICSGGFLSLVNQYLGTDFCLDEIEEYYLQNLIEEDKLKGFYHFFVNSNMYDYGKEIPNAVEVLEKLNQKYNLYICSSFVTPGLREELSSFIKYKYEWIMKNLPFLNPEQVILMSHKQLIDADIRIDDRINNLMGSGSIKILFPSWHNKNISDEVLKSNNIIRVNDWEEIEKILMNS